MDVKAERSIKLIKLAGRSSFCIRHRLSLMEQLDRSTLDGTSVLVWQYRPLDHGHCVGCPAVLGPGKHRSQELGARSEQPTNLLRWRVAARAYNAICVAMPHNGPELFDCFFLCGFDIVYC
jgi:hypothetical protein